MRSQRLSLFLATLLILSLIVLAGFAGQMGTLRSRVEGFDAQLEEIQAQQRDERRRLERALDDKDSELAESQIKLRELQDQFGGIRQERDQLKAERDELKQKTQQLELLLQNLQSMNQINQQVIALRELSPRENVPRAVLTRHEYRQRLEADMERWFPPEEERRERSKLLALEMIDPHVDLRSAIIEDQVKYVLGYYDPELQELFVISDRGSMGVEDRITYAHEYTHFLQDQTFDLEAMLHDGLSGDAGLAVRGLVEGDATLNMYFWLNDHLSDIDRLTYAIDQIEKIGEFLGNGFGTDAGAVVESIGAFPYTYGFEFVYGVYRAGGWPAVDRLYRYPPRSSAQILHPELYVRGIGPVTLGLPDLASRLGPGWELIDSDVMGEFYLRVYLEHQVSISQAVRAAEGWRGDRIAVLEGPNDSRALMIRVAMSNAAQAGELVETYSSFMSSRGGSPSPSVFSATSRQWSLPDRQVHLGRAGSEVLILHAPDAGALQALRGAFPGF